MFLSLLIVGIVWTLCVIVACIVISKLTDAITRAPFLDIAFAMMSWVPWMWFAGRFGWTGFWAIVLAQCISIVIFSTMHTMASGYRGPKIRRTLDRIVGPVGNHVGLWITAPALPVFWMLRLAEVTAYPLLVGVLRFPAYNQGEWVNVSRQKFGGLVGHDLVWCLYCDWMTGVYSLGAEMLRNVESFWCPIRFYENKKCENCKLDFPDVKEWVPREGSMKDVTELLDKKYAKDGTPSDGWFGHKRRKKN